MIFLYLSILIVVCSFLFYMFFLHRTKSFFTQNKKLIDKTPEDYKIVYEKVYFNSVDGIELVGWFIPSRTESDTTLIITHKDGQTKSDALSWSVELSERFNLLYFDFRGCGESKGDFFSYGVEEIKDIEGAIRFLRDFRDEFARNIVLFVYGSVGFCVLKHFRRRDDRVKVVVYEPIEDICNYIAGKLRRTFFVPFASFFIKKFINTDFLARDDFRFKKDDVFIFSMTKFYDFETFYINGEGEVKKKLIEIALNI